MKFLFSTILSLLLTFPTLAQSKQSKKTKRITATEEVAQPAKSADLNTTSVDTIHISKGNIFDAKQQSYVATAIQKYLEEIFDSVGGIVMPELCLSIDVFGDRIVSAPKDISQKIKDIETTCEEVKKIWYAV